MKKRILTVLLAVLMLVSFVSPAAATQIEDLAEEIGSIALFQDGVPAALAIDQFSAAAVHFEHFARDLNSLGLFQGVGGGNFALDRAPTRAEALVMLIRLLGAEEAALAGSYTHPFVDVRGWAAPYIAFAYEYGLTTGTTATTFTPNASATAQQYVTFVLRALGYSDAPGGDFTWSNALQFGMNQVGVWDPILADGPFLRGHVAAVSYLAIAAIMADEDYMLLEVLVREGVVSTSAAAPVLRRIDNYDLYLMLENVLARSVVTGGSSRQTTRLSATINGQTVSETSTFDHPLPTDLVDFLEFDAFPFSTLVLLTEITATSSDNQTILTKTFRDAYLAFWLDALAAGVADELAAELGSAVSVLGTPTGHFEERITINAADRVTAISMRTQLSMNIQTAGLRMTINVDWPTNLNVAFRG